VIQPGKILGVRLGGEPDNYLDHFYTCKQCGLVDKRDLGQVFHHEVRGHQPLPES
jgi:translation initiation factor 2 beta subunit (eIF-2beta)/eIF-5